MRLTSNDAATLAVHRFGLGARPGELKTVGNDPRGWLKQQLTPGLPSSRRLAMLPSHPEVFRRMHAARETGVDKAARKAGRQIFREERAARFAHAATTPHGFRERWVRFFSNHLCVSARKRPITGIVGAHEREVVRAHAVGPFPTMLTASTRHPAMLVYLDNQQSVGPDSPLGRSKQQGLNENLAREVLELHTLGVDGGYTQDDVIALAQMLTGWTVLRPRDADKMRDTAFVYARRRHQPGTKTLLGTAYPHTGEDEALDALRHLGTHPATARHIARKLVTHFVADDPPDAIVDDLARTFRDTDGDLRAVGEALVDDDRVWSRAARSPKLRTPEEVAIAMVRATGWEDTSDALPEQVVQLERGVEALGQAVLAPPSPAGWPDRQEDWSGPEQILRRVELAERVGRRLRSRVDNPEQWAEAILGSRLHPDTRRAITRATDPGTALALVLASPEFQWR